MTFLIDNLETASMFRHMQSALGYVLVLSFVPVIHAQTAPVAGRLLDSVPYGVAAYADQSYGGFGLEYAQPLASGGVIMDQYGMLHDVPYTPYLAAPAPVAAARPAAVARASRTAAGRPGRQPRYQLTTGSLGQGGGNGVILYSPAMRQQSYGNGYGHGPYGVTDYTYMWKGWPTD